ncbi:hypothetical protein ACWC5F_25805 [Streptomyces sp. NPDC001272]
MSRHVRYAAAAGLTALLSGAAVFGALALEGGPVVTTGTSAWATGPKVIGWDSPRTVIPGTDLRVIGWD